jgi:hypothetical protein
MLIVSNGICPGGDTIIIQIPIITSGMDDVNGSPDLLIAPNPVRNQLSIINYQLSISNIEIYNVVGEKIFFKQQTNDKLLTIDVSQLPSGLYYIKVRDEKNNLMTKKIVKM